MAPLGLGLGLGLGMLGGVVESPDMILVYEIPDPNTDIELAIQANSTWFGSGQSVVIDWGDGSTKDTVSATSGHTGYIGHTYTAARTYTIKISGSMTMYGREEEDYIEGQELLTRVESFGKLGITSFYYAFIECTGLTSAPKTLPSNVTNMSSMFDSCSGAAFNPDVSNWNVSNVTNMAYMFYSCSGAAFNPDVSNWNVSKVTDMDGMFEKCNGAAFNPDVSAWNVSNVTNMAYMLDSCSGAAFNPDVSNWNVSNVTNMAYMFYSCSGAAFNPDVSNWNVSNVTNMAGMFESCNGAAFNPDMKSWTLKTGVRTAYMFGSTTTQPTTWLDELLIAWAANPAQGNNITINFSPNSFSETTEGEPIPAVAAALATLIGKGWSITTENPYPAP
jgi:surface protein